MNFCLLESNILNKAGISEQYWLYKQSKYANERVSVDFKGFIFKFFNISMNLFHLVLVKEFTLAIPCL